MDNGDQTETTGNQALAEKTQSNDTKATDKIPVTTEEIAAAATEAVETATIAALKVVNEKEDNQLITSNVKVQIDADTFTTNPIGNNTDTNIANERDDLGPNTSNDLETTQIEAKNSSLPAEIITKTTTKSQYKKYLNTTNDAVTNNTNDELSSLDAALDNINEQVTKLLDEAQASNIKSDSPDAPLDEALAILNSEVLGLLKESRKVQDELNKANKESNKITNINSRCGSSDGIHKTDENQYFDYSIYRERSQSPPPHPLITYRWEDIRRDKEKGGYPWTYLHPQDGAEKSIKTEIVENKCEKSETDLSKLSSVTQHLDQAAAVARQIEQQTLDLPTPLLPDSNAPPTDLLSFNFDNIDTQRAIDSYSIKSSVKNSSSGILEVLQDLEAEEERENERKKLKASTTQSQQDLSTFKPKEESKRFALRSFLKRSHSAPKKVQVAKIQVDNLDEREKSPQQVKCCHPIVEKLKTMADKQLHKKATQKKTKTTTIKTLPISDKNKIILAEQTKIIRLKDSPKAERKNVAAYLEKRDSDDIVEILHLDESPSGSRKRREEYRKIEGDEEREKNNEEINQQKQHEPDFVVPSNLTGLLTEPTVEELLEEEFKNDPPIKAPRKTKEHIYEEIESPGAITQLNAQKLKRPGNIFACAVLHSVLNKDEFKENLKKQNEFEDAEDERIEKIAIKLQTTEIKSKIDDIKPIPDEVIDLKSTEEIHIFESLKLNDVKEINDDDSAPVSDIQIRVDESINVEKIANESEDFASKDDGRKDVLVREEKKVKFSQSTEEYQEKLAAEKGPEKEDIELPEHIKISKRWSELSDHEYEPIGEPVANTKPEQSSDRPVLKITEPEPPTTEQPKPDIVHEERISYDGSESPIRSITPFTDVSRTEDLHTSQIDDSVIEELPLRREDRKKKSFMTNAGETTKNLQNKISSQASNLRTKFKRSLKSSNGSGTQKPIGSNLKSSLKSSPKTSPTSPKERKKFKRIDFTNKIKSIHMPKMSIPELPKFKMPDKLKISRNETQPEMSADVPTKIATVEVETITVDGMPGPSDDAPTVVSITTEEIIETKPTGKKRFEFGSYPKLFSRFKLSQQHQQCEKSNAVEHDVTDFMSENTTTERDMSIQPSSSSFSTHFATVPRTASKIKNSIISKWNKTSFAKSNNHDEDIEKIPHGSFSQHDESHEDSVERRIHLASKISMDDEEEPLGILQTKEQIQLANYDEENRAIHEISRAREQEFKARKPPLVHQDSDVISDESNREIDWEECERIRNKIMGIKQQAMTCDFDVDVPKRDAHGRRLRTDSNFSTEETQSSGSSGDRRRTGVIEDIDDDEFFLRQRGVSQDNAEISKYISSAIREGHASYSFDSNVDDFTDEYHHTTDQPRKPMRRRHDDYNRSFESYVDYRNDHHSDNEIPVATQYFPRHDDENLSFYDNEFVDDLDHPNILSRDEHFDSDIDNDHEFRPIDVKPKVPKRRRKERMSSKQDSVETNDEVLVYRSELSFTVPIDEPKVSTSVVKAIRKKRSISLKSDLESNQEVQKQCSPETETINKYSPNNSQYTINIRETNGYATVKKEPPARPPAPTRRKRSIKSLDDTLQRDNVRTMFKDSPFPERQTRNFNISAPARPPRRGSSSSLIDHHKPPSIAPSDGTQYEEIDDNLNDDDNEFYSHKMQNRPLPPPPRPPRDKKRREKSNIDRKFDDNDDNAGQLAVLGSFDDSEFSTREFVGAEMATQTSMDIEDLYLNEDVPDDHETAKPYAQTVEEILRSSDAQQQKQHDNSTRTSDDNLTKGIQKFRESNQRSYSERSRGSTERQSSRPITPSPLFVGQNTAYTFEEGSSPPKLIDYRTDSAESEYVPYADDVDDTHLDTEDERIINAAIRRYQIMGNEINEGSLVRESTPKANDDFEEKSNIEAPQPPPRRKSSANASQITETITVPLAEVESSSISSTQDLSRLTSEPVNDLSSENAEPTHAQVESLTVVNIQSDDTTTVALIKADTKSETKTLVNNLQISPEVLQEIIERVRETLPVQPSASQLEQPIISQTTPPPSPEESESTVQENDVKIMLESNDTKINDNVSNEKKEKKDDTTTPTSEIPASFYQLRTGISEDESSLPPSTIPAKHRSRKHIRRTESSSDEEYSRRHHHHSQHGGGAITRTGGRDFTITDLSGQLIRACGRALSSSLNTAGHSLVDFLRGLTKNQDDHQKDLSLVLIILIIIVASLMMLGLSGDRSVHHHHWDYFNPPDNIGRR